MRLQLKSSADDQWIVVSAIEVAGGVSEVTIWVVIPGVIVANRVLIGIVNARASIYTIPGGVAMIVGVMGGLAAKRLVV